jgi:predicted TPR repeat methyltransferase
VGGVLVFTLEALAAGADAIIVQLQSHGRYAHDGAHVRRVFEAAGLIVARRAPQAGSPSAASDAP